MTTPSITFNGDATATIQIGTHTIPLQGKIGGGTTRPSNNFELSYHAKTLDDAIDLGGFLTAFTELASTLGIKNADGTPNLNAFQTALKPVSDIFQAIPQSPLGINFIDKLKEVMLEITNTGVPLIDDTIHPWLTDFVLKVDAGTANSAEATLGLAFEFTDLKLFNIKLLSAGILVTLKVD